MAKRWQRQDEIKDLDAMAETVRNERFLPWREACMLVGDKQVLKESDELYFRYAGFASVELGEKSYDRVHVNGFLRLYPADVQDLRRGFSVNCNSALVNDFIEINGSFNNALLEKFIVFDDELVIGAGAEPSPNDDLTYPSSIYYRESELLKLCERFGLIPKGGDFDQISNSTLQRVNSAREADLLYMVGGLACLLARQKGIGDSQEWYHLSDAFIDDLFELMVGLGILVDGRNKFRYERLIAEGVKFINRQAGSPNS
ncbi:MAG: hypothetical protein PVF13_05125 [Chromatiales bacterium]